MSYWKRVLSGFTGKDRHRLPDEMAVLGAPQALVDRVRRMGLEEQEQAFIYFAEGKHACMLEWRAEREDVFSELMPLLAEEERRLLPHREHCPADAAGTISAIRKALTASGRRLVQTESFGDFSFLILVPAHKEGEFVRAVGPWLIEPDRK